MELARTDDDSSGLAVTESDGAAPKRIGGRFGPHLEGFGNLPLVRQLGLMFGLAASIALIIVVVLWSQEDAYGVLYSSLSNSDAAQIAETLQAQGVEYRIDETTGAIMVPSAKIHEIRLSLANEGLPKSSGVGFDILKQDPQFGTSQFMETARYNHALETELARSITTVSDIAKARVHLALPKQSVFVRKRQEPSASVLVNLHSGRKLSEHQVAAITHLVASSIPNLAPERVTVVDQKGRLLSGKKRDEGMAANDEQFEYRRRVEESYVRRVENLLAPIVGFDGIRAEVNAELDFTVTEQTQESYNPDLPALRSKQTVKEKTVGQTTEGVPGALSNQPPGEATAPEVATGEGDSKGKPVRSREQSTANYELDRTISHTRLASGEVRRLSVAVIIDDKTVVNEEGETVRQPWSDVEVDRFRTLVREAIGYNPRRGDSVNVVNVSFHDAEVEPVPELPYWKQPWVWDLAKKIGGVLAGLLLLAVIVRPLLKSLAEVAPQHDDEGPEEQLALTGPTEVTATRLPGPGTYEQNLALAREMAQQDPQRVAQVIRMWAGSD